MEIKGVDVITYLRPDGGWVMRGNDFAGIDFIDCEPFTEKVFENAFATVKQIKEKAEADNAAAKASAQAKLAALGLTEEEVASVLG